MPEPLSIDDVMAWLQTKAMRARNPADLLTGLGDRLCAADLPLSAMTLGITTLRFVALNAVEPTFPLACRVLSDPFGYGPSETEHIVENIDAHHRLGLLGRQVTRSQTGTDDPFVTGHRRFDQGPPVIPR